MGTPAFALGAQRYCPAMPTGGPHDLNRTVMSPYQGGPVYLWLRSSWIYIRRHMGRHLLRWIDRNWDYQRACMYGCPEMHIDPTTRRRARAASAGSSCRRTATRGSKKFKLDQSRA